MPLSFRSGQEYGSPRDVGGSFTRYLFQLYLNQYNQDQENESKGTEVKVKICYPDQDGSCQ